MKESTTVRTISLEPGDRGARAAAAWNRLQQAAVGRTSTLNKSLNWVYENLGIPVDKIDPATVPSPGSVNHLQALQQSPVARNDFILAIGRAMVTRAQRVAEKTVSDHGEPALELIAKFERMLAEKATEAVGVDAELMLGDAIDEDVVDGS